MISTQTKRSREQFEEDQKAFDDSSFGEESAENPSKQKVVRPVVMYRPDQNQLDLYKPGKEVRVFVPAKYLLSSEKAGNDRKIFGTDIYSDSTDIILACQHMGLLQDLPLSNSKGILVTVLIEKPPSKYEATFRNNVRSRSWTNISHSDSNAYKIIGVKAIEDDTLGLTKPIPVDKSNFSHGIEQHRFLSNVTIVFGLSCEPAVKYTINSVSDRGYNHDDLTSYRLKNGEKLILETETSKYELRFENSNYVWSQINMESREATPIYTDLEWKDIKWGHESVLIKDHEYKLTLTFFKESFGKNQQLIPSNLQ